MDDNIFYAETQYGHTVKVLTEVYYGCLTNEAFYRLETTGIRSICSDNRFTTLLNLDLPRGNFDKYICKQDISIAINLKHLQKLLKNIKKKDSITLFIKKSVPNKLGIKIVPIILTKKADKSETSFINIREVTLSGIAIPTGYHFPKVIASTDYQKMCKKMAVVPGKIINITIQQDNFISFFCDGDIISSDVTLGTKDPNISFYILDA